MKYCKFVFKEDVHINQLINFDCEKFEFNEVIFEKRCFFENYIFEKEVNFINCVFKEKVSFKNSKFNKNIKFINCIFEEKYCNEKSFENCFLYSQNILIKSCENLPRLDGIRLDEYTKIIMINLEYSKRNYLTAKINYKIAKNQSNKIGDYERIGYYYYKERAYGSKTMKIDDYPRKSDYISAKVFDYLAKYTVGYGERPLNIFFISLITVSIFAIFYMIIGVKTLDGNYISLETVKNSNDIINTYIDFWYFSLVTFTTVGYGDMIVTSSVGKVLVSIEVFFGVTIAATWTSVIIKRMIR